MSVKIIVVALCLGCLNAFATVGTAQEVSFQRHIAPLLTRAGCNAGACHGAAAGRGGLHLSLFGSDPQADYQSLVHEFEGRRINRVSSTKSLLLRKPLGELDHGGDQIFDAASFEYRSIHQWLEAGARMDTTADLIAFRTEVVLAQPDTPLSSSRLLQPQTEVATIAAAALPHSKEVAIYDLRAWARWPDEKVDTDVTAHVQFAVMDTDAVRLDAEHAQVQLLRPGRHVIIARYLDRIEAITLSLPFPAKTDEPTAQQLLSNNLIDSEVHNTLTELNLPAGAPTSDAEFLRRATLDLTGRLTGLEEVNDFLQSQIPDKRARLIDRLLASPAFDDYWTHIMSRWLHLHSLPNESQGVEAFGKWIHQCVSDGVSWREMIHHMLTATGDSHVVGPANLCRMVGDARSHAELVSEVFLGARLACANCHDHPLDRWTQDDYHGLAAMLARIERGRHVRFASRGDVTHPKTSSPARQRLPGDRFVDTEMDAVTPPPQILAQWLTESQQDRLARAFTNRVWNEMFGRGLVNAVDDLRETNPASHPQLLNQLARHVAQHNFDLRSLLRWITSSETYARQSSDQADAFYGWHQSRPFSPHVLADAIADVTGVPASYERRPIGTRAVHMLDPLSLAPELDALGRCRRVADCAGPHATSGLAAQLHLINGDIINQRLIDPDGRLNRLIHCRTTAEIIEEFSLRAFSERPTAAQLESWVKQLEHVKMQERTERLQDWLWSILSSQRFQHNH